MLILPGRTRNFPAGGWTYGMLRNSRKFACSGLCRPVNTPFDVLIVRATSLLETFSVACPRAATREEVQTEAGWCYRETHFLRIGNIWSEESIISYKYLLLA